MEEKLTSEKMEKLIIKKQQALANLMATLSVSQYALLKKIYDFGRKNQKRRNERLCRIDFKT